MRALREASVSTVARPSFLPSSVCPSPQFGYSCNSGASLKASPNPNTLFTASASPCWVKTAGEGRFPAGKQPNPSGFTLASPRHHLGIALLAARMPNSTVITIIKKALIGAKPGLFFKENTCWLWRFFTSPFPGPATRSFCISFGRERGPSSVFAVSFTSCLARPEVLLICKRCKTSTLKKKLKNYL